MRDFFLYNPLAGEGKADECAKSMKSGGRGDTVYLDMTKIDSYGDFFRTLERDDRIIVCGGDGTLNRFINSVRGLAVKNDIVYYPAGSGNDFMHDLGRSEEDGPFRVNDLTGNLPKVWVKGKEYRFINGVGCGIDGYVCARGNDRRADGRQVNYTAIALKALAVDFKPVNAVIQADGEVFKYKKVWMATAMNGRFFGGGMMVAPQQDRHRADGKISVVLVHDVGKFRILTLFPSIFKGGHLKYTRCVSLHECSRITVKYDRPCDLQIDGETIPGVTEYTAEANRAPSPAASPEKEPALKE